MARYVKDFLTNADPQTVHFAVNQYLQSEGYEYINYDGENVFKKGNGVWSNPTFFKFSYTGNSVKMESWMKYAFFPGVYVGELGVDGFVGCAVKGPWKKRIGALEGILSRFTTQSVCYSATPTQNNFCNGCGNYLPENAQFCTVCGRKRLDTNIENTISQSTSSCQQTVPQTNYYAHAEASVPPVGFPISKKEFINKYAQPSLRKNITSIAILCYVCSGLTFIVSCIFNPWGIIDALILLGLALGMHLAKSKVCAILILILSIIEVLMSIVSGSFPFWWLVAGISAVTTFSKIEKQYKTFISNGNKEQ